MHIQLAIMLLITGHLDIQVQMRCYTLMTFIPHGVINTV